MSNSLQDLRCGLRALLRDRGVTLAAWLSLTLGIGALAATFSVVDGLLLEPLPYAGSDRLVLVWESDLLQPERRMGSASDATFEDWRREARSFDSLSAARGFTLSLTSMDVPESLMTRRITASHFPLLGVAPLFGRNLSSDEEKQGAKVVILSYSAWQRLFGGDRSILGREVQFDNEAYEVIGVMPADFQAPIEPAPVQLWIPLRLNPEELDRQRRRLVVFGRLAEGVSVEAAREEMARLAEELRRRHPEVLAGRGAEVRQLQESLVGGLRPALLMLLGAGILLLLIVCGNVAHLLLLRAVARRREMAVRIALGAGRFHLLRQLVSENLLLCLAGAAAGCAMAFFSLQHFLKLIPRRFYLPRLDDVGIDGSVLLFTLAVTLIVALGFGLVPASLGFSRTDLAGDLSAGNARSTIGRRGHLLRALLVVTEVAFVMALLIGAALMVQTFQHLSRQNAARDPSHVLTLRTALRGPNYQDAGQRSDFYQRAIEAIRAVPGVESGGATNLSLLGNPRGSERFDIVGMAAAEPGSEPEAMLQVVTPTYFETLGIPLLQGRHFSDRDTRQTKGVAIVNRLFAGRYLGDLPPIGQTIGLMADGEPREIVGVVDDVRVHNQPPDPVPMIFVPHAQRASATMTFVVRTGTDPELLARSVRAAIGGLDRLMPTYAITTLEQRLEEADWQTRFSMLFLGFFALLALVLAVTGIYAVISSGIAERTREFGVRIAFGARPGDLLAIVLVNGLRLAALGLGIGLGLSLLLSRLLESQLYGVSGTDPLTYVVLSLLLVLTVLAASCVPALRAMRVEPVTALRHE